MASKPAAEAGGNFVCNMINMWPIYLSRRNEAISKCAASNQKRSSYQLTQKAAINDISVIMSNNWQHNQ
jgi:hypothetical protein